MLSDLIYYADIKNDGSIQTAEKILLSEKAKEIWAVTSNEIYVTSTLYPSTTNYSNIYMKEAFVDSAISEEQVQFGYTQMDLLKKAFKELLNYISLETITSLIAKETIIQDIQSMETNDNNVFISELNNEMMDYHTSSQTIPFLIHVSIPISLFLLMNSLFNICKNC